MCTKGNNCCQLILQQYPQIQALIQDCPPEGQNPTQILSLLLGIDQMATSQIFQRLKCGRVFCCEGIIQAILCAIKNYLADPNLNFNLLVDTINCIISQGGFSPINCDLSLTTFFTGSDPYNSATGGGDMFDIRTTQPILIESFDIHLQVGSNTIEVWIVTGGGTFFGKENNAAAWTLLASYPGIISAGVNIPTPLPPLPVPYFVSAGAIQGIWITGLAGGAQILTTAFNPPVPPIGTPIISDGNLEIQTGGIKNYPLTPGVPPVGQFFYDFSSDWNGTIHYCAVDA